MTTIDYVCFYWGNKYSFDYVSRLRNAVKKYTQKHHPDHRFHVYTDRVYEHCIKAIPDIHWHSLPNSFGISNLFTWQKAAMFNNPLQSQHTVILDLDMLINDNIHINMSSPQLIHNNWKDLSKVKAFHYKGVCPINSSFLSFPANSLTHIYNNILLNKDKINFQFKSFDKLLYYNYNKHFTQHDHITSQLYNSGYKRMNTTLTLFNTSHGKGTELHLSDDETVKYWTGFDNDQ